MCHRRNDAFDCPEFSSLLSLRGEGLRTRHARCRNVSPLINRREADVPTGERRKARTFLRSYVRTCTSVKFMHTCASNQPTPAKDKKQGKPAWFRDCLRERERERERAATHPCDFVPLSSSFRRTYLPVAGLCVQPRSRPGNNPPYREDQETRDGNSARADPVG